MNNHWMYLDPVPYPGQRSTLPENAADELGRPIKHPVAMELIDIIPLNKNHNPIVNVTPMSDPTHIKHPLLLTMGHTHDVKINWYLTLERTQFTLRQYAKNTILSVISKFNLHYPSEVLAPLHSYGDMHNEAAFEWLASTDDNGTLEDRLVRGSIHAIIHSSSHNAAALATQNSMRLHKRGSDAWWEQRNQNNTDLTSLTLHAHQHYPAPTPAEQQSQGNPRTSSARTRAQLLN